MSSAILTRTLFAALSTLAAFMTPSAAIAECDWTVTGTLLAEHSSRVPELGDEGPLENVRVQVKARTKVFGVWGTWNEWDEVRTDSEGGFTVTNSKNCVNRQFKVEVKFQDSDLEVRHSASTSSLTKVHWYTVHQTDGSGFSPSRVSLGNLKFEPGGSGDLGDFEARRHADTWALYKKAIALMESYGSNYAFETQIKVKPIHDGITADSVEAPYTNPTTKVIYIVRNSVSDWFNTETLLHELGHVYAYNHSTGETCLTDTLMDEGTTHGSVSTPCPAFHEGFAEFWMEQVIYALFGDLGSYPFNRVALRSGDADIYGDGDSIWTIGQMERNDMGWFSVFNTLVAGDLAAHHYFNAYDPDPGTDYTVLRYGAHETGLCDAPDIDFRDVLRVLRSDSASGHTSDLDTAEVEITSFLERAEDILSGMAEGDADLLNRIVDPMATSQPYGLFCD